MIFFYLNIICIKKLREGLIDSTIRYKLWSECCSFKYKNWPLESRRAVLKAVISKLQDVFFFPTPAPHKEEACYKGDDSM